MRDVSIRSFHKKGEFLCSVSKASRLLAIVSLRELLSEVGVGYRTKGI